MPTDLSYTDRVRWLLRMAVDLNELSPGTWQDVIDKCLLELDLLTYNHAEQHCEMRPNELIQTSFDSNEQTYRNPARIARDLQKALY